MKKSKKHIDRPMNADTKLKRDKVMNIINEARYVRKYNLGSYKKDFIKVRITDTTDGNEHVLASARMGGYWIWVTARTTERKDLVAIVLHEVLHTVLSTPHYKGCPLMDPKAQNCSDEDAWRLFDYYYNLPSRNLKRIFNTELEEA